MHSQSVGTNRMDLRSLDVFFKQTSEMFPGNTIRKNYFLAACRTLDNKCDLYTINEQCPYGGIIGMGDSKLDCILKRFKFMRLHAVIHDAAGFMRQRYNIGPGYCYMINNCFVNSCFLGHVTGLWYCVHQKVFSSVYPKLFL